MEKKPEAVVRDDGFLLVVHLYGARPRTHETVFGPAGEAEA
jgi:hypothetical protein